MTKELSDKLRIASFIATLVVVLRHSANWIAFFPNGGTPEWLLKSEWEVLFWTDVAVPFFFFVSGFLFMSVDYVADKQYLQMLKKKFRVLFVPFLIWNLVGGCVLFFYDSEGNLGDSFLSCLHNLFLSLWYGPLWYVRDLMIIMLLYPVYGWLYKRYFQWGMILLILYLMWTRWWVGGTEFLSGEGLVFFAIGGLIQKHSIIAEWKSPKWLGLTSFLVWIFFSFCVTSMDWTIHRVSMLIGLPSFWMSLDLISGKLKEWCLRLAPYSFLIYVTHFYLHKVFKVGLALLFPENGIVALIAFFVVPIITAAIIVIVGRYWKQLHPKSYSICMGGRG